MLNLRKVQVFGDSWFVIEWAKGNAQLQVGFFQPLMHQIHSHGKDGVDLFLTHFQRVKRDGRQALQGFLVIG
jgi:hypothetical protein